MRFFRVCSASTQSSVYTRVSYNQRLDLSSSTSNVYYERGKKLGFVPAPGLTTEINLHYYEKYNPMGIMEESDLDPLIQEWVCMKAAELTLEMAGHVNARDLAARRLDYEINTLNFLDQSPRNVREILVGEQVTVTNGGGTNLP